MTGKTILQSKTKSSALGYAISFLLLISLICSGVLFIASANKRLEMNYVLKEHLLFDNLFSLNYGARQRNAGSHTLFHPAGDTSEVSVRAWGAYKIVTANTWHGERQVKKAALIGYPLLEQLPALYLVDNSQSLKVCGTTRIEGEAFVPERGIERSYIGGKHYQNDQLMYGVQKKSEIFLPALNPVYQNLDFSSFSKEGTKSVFIAKDSVYPFDKETVIMSQIEPLTLRNKLYGNIILHSFDSILVSAEAKLENVILIAPVIRIEKGFKGSVQAVAHKKIVCEKGVKLLYPSTLVLNEQEMNLGTEDRCIVLEEGSSIIGGILMTSQVADYRKPVRLSVAENAVIGGLVFNQGETALYGTIIGSIYTRNFRIDAGGGVYTNNLLDAVISSVQIPKEFLYPDWLKEMKLKPAKIITCF